MRIIISIIGFVLYKTNYGSIIKSEFILQFRIQNEDKQVSNNYNKILTKYTKTQTLLSSESSDDKSSIKVSLDIIMKEEFNQNDLLKEISSLTGISEVVIIAAKTEIDY